MKIIRTRRGLRLSQHGVVISELRTSPGPTHSVFDVLAALIHILAPAGRVGVLGFAGGGMMAPLRKLGVESVVHSVDLDRSGYALFCRFCPGWAGQVVWSHSDAVDWLQGQPRDFGLLVEDLSIPEDGDVVKPAVSWSVLPPLIRSRLRRGGVAVSNLMLPPSGRWEPDLTRLAGQHAEARVIQFDEFENRVLVAGSNLPTAQALGRQLRKALRGLRSRQASRVCVKTLR